MLHHASCDGTPRSHHVRSTLNFTKWGDRERAQKATPIALMLTPQDSLYFHGLELSGRMKSVLNSVVMPAISPMAAFHLAAWREAWRDS